MTGKELAINQSPVRAWDRAKTMFSHMDSKEGGLEILQGVSVGVGFQSQRTDSVGSSLTFTVL